MSNIWFSSDFHGYHKNICEGSSRWENKKGCRPFRNEYEMTDKLVENVNKVVKYDDTLYFLGDWSFGGTKNIYNLWKRIVCKNIHLVLGNHDESIRDNRVIPSLLEEYYTNHGTNTSLTEEEIAGAQNLFLSVQSDLFLKINGQHIHCYHFPVISHNKENREGWMIHGHCHGNLPKEYYRNKKMIDVSIETHPEFRPYHIDEIRSLLR